jgi:hypothetical protein
MRGLGLRQIAGLSEGFGDLVGRPRDRVGRIIKLRIIRNIT